MLNTTANHLDDLAEQCRDSAVREIRDLLAEFKPEHLTAVELIAMLSVVRSARDRIEAEKLPAAPVLQLVRIIREEDDE